MMMNLNGNLPEKKSSVQSLDWSLVTLLEMLLLVMAGGLAAYMHFRLRIPLNMPGHHGLEFMAIISLVRLSSNLKYAGMLAMLGTGIVLLIPGLGGGTMMHAFSYLLPGLVLDLFYNADKERMRLLFTIAIASGIAYMFIPLSRLLLNIFTGYPYMAFVKFGAVYTILSFFLFGMTGGLLGFTLNRIKNRLTKSENEKNA